MPPKRKPAAQQPAESDGENFPPQQNNKRTKNNNRANNNNDDDKVVALVNPYESIELNEREYHLGYAQMVTAFDQHPLKLEWESEEGDEMFPCQVDPIFLNENGGFGLHNHEANPVKVASGEFTAYLTSLVKYNDNLIAQQAKRVAFKKAMTGKPIKWYFETKSNQQVKLDAKLLRIAPTFRPDPISRLHYCAYCDAFGFVVHQVNHDHPHHPLCFCKQCSHNYHRMKRFLTETVNRRVAATDPENQIDIQIVVDEADYEGKPGDDEGGQ